MQVYFRTCIIAMLVTTKEESESSFCLWKVEPARTAVYGIGWEDMLRRSPCFVVGW